VGKLLQQRAGAAERVQGPVVSELDALALEAVEELADDAGREAVLSLPEPVREAVAPADRGGLDRRLFGQEPGALELGVWDPPAAVSNDRGEGAPSYPSANRIDAQAGEGGDLGDQVCPLP
jgi:hypothetical protein